MNLLRRAVARELLLSCRSSRSAVLQKPYFLYSTATSTSTIRARYTSKKPKTLQQAQVPQVEIEKEEEQVSSSIWPRPSEIPWQPSVSNSVNLIGRVQIPVQFEASPDGKYWAGTIIAQRDGTSSASPPFWIPVIFEGDQAHVAAKHLKPKDCIHISGQLSADPPPFTMSEGKANVQVMAHSISFVEGSSEMKRAITPHNLEEWGNNSIGKALSVDKLRGTERETHYNTSLKSANASHEDPILSSWRDLLKNSKQWWDNRGKKLNGLVSPRHPDFKHKDSGVGLWLNTAPKWVLSELDGLEIDLKVPTGKQGKESNDGQKVPTGKQGKESNGIDSWNNLVDNPNEWWDNRKDKKNAKSPDFKHKVTGKALWLSDSPAWITSRLPPLKVKSPAATFGRWSKAPSLGTTS